MQQVEDTDTGKGLCDDVGEEGGAGVGVHGSQLCGAVEELGDCVDDDEDVGNLELVGFPEEQPGCRKSGSVY